MVERERNRNNTGLMAAMETEKLYNLFAFRGKSGA